MPEALQKTTSKRHHKKNKKQRGQRGPGKSVRADRQEACRLLAAALIENPLASAPKLAEAAWPGGGKAAAERARRALADLTRKPWLAGDLADQVQEALTRRKAAAEAARQERERRKAAVEAARQERKRRKAEREAEKKKREAEREARFRLQPARALMRRLLRHEEVAAEISRIVAARRRFIQAGQEGDHDRWWLFPRRAGQVPAGTPVHHPAPGLAGQVITSATATRAANRELAAQYAIANMLSLPWQAALDILAAVRKLRRAVKKGDIMAEAWARGEMKLLIRRGLAVAAPVDPAEWAGQYSAEIAGMSAAAREMAAAKEAGLWPLPGVVNVTPPDADDEPEPWPGAPLDAPPDGCGGLEPVDDGGVDPVIAEIFPPSAVVLAGGRRRGKGGAKTSAAQRAAAQEGLHPAT